MFNITKAIHRGAIREPFIRKRGHNHYKGTGVGSLGRHTKRGDYSIDLNKVRHYVVPDLEGFQLTPYVSHRTPQIWKTCKAEDFLNKSS